MRHYFLNPSKKQKYLIAFVDTVLIGISIFISYYIKVYFNTGAVHFDTVLEKIKMGHFLIIPAHMFTLYVANLYSLKMISNPVRMSIKIVISVIVAAILITGCLFFFPKYVFGRQVLLIHVLVLSFLLVLWRSIVLKISGFFQNEKKIALVCCQKIAKLFVNELSQLELNSFRISHILYVGDQNKGTLEKLTQKDIIFCSSLSDLLSNNNFDVLVFDSSNISFSNKEIQLILETRQKNKEVYDIPNLYKNLTGKVPLEYIDGRWLLDRDDLQGFVGKPYLRLKRMFDVVLSLVLILLFPLLWFIITFAIKMESKGPVIFSQERLGLNRKPFTCYKFRTMIENAEDLSGPVWAQDEDPRITKVGSFLRLSRLEE